MSRLFTGYASDYSADQVQPRRVRRFQQRQLKVNFNAVLAKGETIAQIIWDTNAPWSTIMSNPSDADSGKAAVLTVKYNYQGMSWVRCQITGTAGTVFTYMFSFMVANAPLMPADTYLSAYGPYRLVWNASPGEVIQITALNGNIQAASFTPYPDGLLSSEFQVQAGSELVEFTWGGTYWSLSDGTPIDGAGVLIQGANSWPCQITYTNT